MAQVKNISSYYIITICIHGECINNNFEMIFSIYKKNLKYNLVLYNFENFLNTTKFEVIFVKSLLSPTNIIFKLFFGANLDISTYR